MEHKEIATFGPFNIHFGDVENSITLSIRELEASQFFKQPKSSREYSKFSGCMIWDCAVVLARFIFHHQELFKGKSVIELGSGCGVSGILVSHFCERVILTDYIEPVLDNLRFNVQANGNENIEIKSLDWNTIDEKDEKFEKVDIIIGSEITYEEEHGNMLIKVLKALLKKGGTFYEILEAERQGLDIFQALLIENGFSLQVEDIPVKLLEPWDGDRPLELNEYRFLKVTRNFE